MLTLEIRMANTSFSMALTIKNGTEKIAVVTGNSSGIGFETSLLLAKNGFRIYATVRNPNKAKALRDISDKGELPISSCRIGRG